MFSAGSSKFEQFGPGWCRRRRRRSIHIVKMLQRRESGRRKPGTVAVPVILFYNFLSFVKF